MELDSKGLGRLRRVANARDVWTSEAGDFTPWLAEYLDVLGDELGMSLTLVATEVPVGQFRLDIRAQTRDESVVIIENQLERTDHSHLGQILVYASGLDASTVVWVAPEFREDHRQALDWLNERTDSGVGFFGVEVSVVQIGETGPRAPVFEVVARPNGWQKGVKETGTVAGAGTATQPGGVNTMRQDFFAEVLTEVVSHRPGIRLPTRSNGNWLSYAAGPWGNWSLTLAAQLRIEAYIDAGPGFAGVNKKLFDELEADAADWERQVGHLLTWEPLDGKRACRVAAYHPVTDLTNVAERDALKAWAVQTAVALYDVMNTRLRERAQQLKSTAKLQGELLGAAGALLDGDEAPPLV